MENIFYRAGYKYQLSEEYSTDIPTIPDDDIDTEYIDLSSAGGLRIKQGYAGTARLVPL